MTFLKRTLLFAAVVLASAALLLGASFFSSADPADANNPPTTLLGTVAVDPGQDQDATDPTPVWALLEANGRYYIAGQFTEVGGVSRPYLAAIEVATGQLDPVFSPVIAGGNTEILTISLSPDEQDLYIGGVFTSVDGTTRNRIAKLDAITGALDPNFNPNASAAVETINVGEDGAVYVGGRFTTIGGVTSPNLIKLDPATGQADASWNASTNGTVLDIEAVGNNVYVGGNFTELNGQPHQHLVRLRTDSSIHPSWNVTDAPPARVQAISLSQDRNTIYAGTAGTLSNGGNGNSIWAYSKFGDREWQRVLAGDVQALEASATTLYVGTHGQFVYDEPKFLLDGVTLNPNFPVDGYVESPTNPNATRREKLLRLDLATGELEAWDPHLNSVNGVWELERGPSGLLVGGDFTQVLNPTGVTGSGPAIFTPHVAIFPNIEVSNDAPEPLFSFDCAGTACNFDASASIDDGSITSYSWDFGNGTTATSITPTATLANNTTHTVTLTVTDNSGTSASRQQEVLVGNGGLPVTHIRTTTLSDSNNTFAQSLPANAQAGDVALAFLSISDGNTVGTAPAGWVFVGQDAANNLTTTIWYRALSANDPGSNAQFQLSSSTKADLTISTYRGVDTANPILAVDSIAESERRVGHRAPALSFSGEATVLHYWADRTSVTTEFFAPPSEATLSTSIGTGNAHVSSVLSVVHPAPSNGSSQAVAVAEHHSLNALGWSIALREGAAPVDTTDPTGSVTFPANASTTPTGTTTITGTATDDISGINRVLVQVRRLTTPREYWNGTAWTTTPRWLTATLDNNGTNTTWTVPNVNFDETGPHQLTLNIRDNANNVATSAENPITNITIGATDTTDPTGSVTFPANASTTPTGTTTITGTATDDISGINRVLVQVRRLTTPREYWNGTAWTTTPRWLTATLDNNGTNTTWTVPNVNFDETGPHQLTLNIRDNANNVATSAENPITNITIG